MTPPDAPLLDDPGAVAENLHRRLFRISTSFRRHEFEQIANGGLTLTQCSLLYILRDKQRLRMSELAAHERLTLPTVTRAVTRLKDLGLVTRTRDLSDHRNIWIEITPKGVELQRSAVESLMNAMLSGMSPAEVVALDEALGPLERLVR